MNDLVATSVQSLCLIVALKTNVLFVSDLINSFLLRDFNFINNHLGIHLLHILLILNALQFRAYNRVWLTFFNAD